MKDQAHSAVNKLIDNDILPVDVVYTWVNGSDSDQKKNLIRFQKETLEKSLNGKNGLSEDLAKIFPDIHDSDKFNNFEFGECNKEICLRKSLEILTFPAYTHQDLKRCISHKISYMKEDLFTVRDFSKELPKGFRYQTASLIKFNNAGIFKSFKESCATSDYHYLPAVYTVSKDVQSLAVVDMVLATYRQGWN